MNAIISFLRSDVFGLILMTMVVISIILIIYLFIKTIKLNKRYLEFISKFDGGENIEETLKKYMREVENVKTENKVLSNTCKETERNMEKCIQKIGMVRYSAFQNTGSDLSFALALLDFEDNGVIINGIYSRDNTTTTYAKPVEKGISRYTLVKEEAEALELARQNGYKYYINIDK